MESINIGIIEDDRAIHESLSYKTLRGKDQW